MSEFPDLGIPQTEHFFHGASEITEPKEEGVFYTRSGQLIGDVATFVGTLTQTLTVSEKYDTKFKLLAPNLAKTCCRLVVVYQLDPIDMSCTGDCGDTGDLWCCICKKFICTDCIKKSKCIMASNHFTSDAFKLNEEFNTFAQKSYTGTAFRVSEKMLLTAKHTIKPSHVVESSITKDYTRLYHKPRACVIAAHDARFDATSLHERPDTYEVKIVDDAFNYEEHFDKSAWERPIPWKQAFDFCMIEFISPKPPSVDLVPIAIPGLSSHQQPPMNVMVTDETPPLRIFAAGYPSTVIPTKFFEDHIPRYGKDLKAARKSVETLEQFLKELQRKYDEVSKVCGGFERVIISFAEHVDLGETGTLQGHKCPSLRGTSGGIVGYLVFWGNYSVVVFAGLHLGGSAEMINNVFVSNYDPAFAVHYAKFVLQNPDDSTLRALIMAPQPVRQFITYHAETFARFGVVIHPRVLKIVNQEETQEATSY